MPVRDDPPNLVEVKIREEIRKELLEERARSEESEALSQRDRRVLALALSVLFALGFMLPVLGLIIGLGVRAFRFASGL